MADLKTTNVKDGMKQEQSKDASKDPNTSQLPADGSGQQTATSAAQQAAANLSTEQARGTVFGDTTSSRGDSNEDGRHGRDGGSSLSEPQAGSPNNPAPDAQTVGDSPEQLKPPKKDADKDKDDAMTARDAEVK